MNQNAPTKMSPPHQIKGYELHERIGSGGFGIVHRALQTTVGREVAIKIILPHFANNPEFIRRFEQEAQLVARLEHLHIVPLYDYWRDPQGAYLVSRFMRGGSLDASLRKGPYDIATAHRLLNQIVGALDMSHRNGIVHRDLKPANILLDEEGNAYLTDFGIAKDIRQQSPSSTGTDVIIGSPDYLSPEQARNDPITTQADIYNLGVVVYEILMGEHPFPNLSAVERMYSHLNQAIPDVTNLPENIITDVNAVIQKATAKNPAHRYADVLAFGNAFRQAIAPALSDSSISIEEQLTLREHEVLSLIVVGHTNREIAQELSVTLGTVKWYVRQIYQKLHVRSRVQAIVRARELDLIVPDDNGMNKPDLEADIATKITRSLPDPVNPYKGLRAFQAADARDFFGREKLIEKLLKHLSQNGNTPRFLAVVGPSGSGKSSVVRAGLVPALWRGDINGSDRWFIVEMVPGAYPLDELEIALTRIAADQGTNLHENLTRDARGLVRVGNLILPDDGSELVVIVDQLEELFTLVDDEEARAHFLNLLCAAATEARSRVRIIVTLRADFYDRPLHYPEFGELVRNHMETVLPLSADDLEAAITQPAERVGMKFESGLVSRIVADVHYQPGALPLMQYALTELFDQRDGNTLTQAVYEAIGGAGGSLARRADEVYTEYDTAGRDAIRQMFLRLVSPGDDGVDTRRRVARAELLDIAEDPELMDDIIDMYADYRLLTLDHDPRTRKPMVEVAHEAILGEWERLHSWLSESRNDIRQQNLLAYAAREWQLGNQDNSYLLRGTRLEAMREWARETRLALTADEHAFLNTSIAESEQQAEAERERQQRELDTQRQLAERQRQAANRLRYLVGALAIFLVGALGLTGFALNEQTLARIAREDEAEARALAEDNLQQAQTQRLALEAISLSQLDTESDLVALLAMHSINTEYTPQGDFAIQRAIQRAFPEMVIQTELSLSQNSVMAQSVDGKWLAVGGINNQVAVYDVVSASLVAEFEGGDLMVFLPDNRTLVTTGTQQTNLYVWDVPTQTLLHRQENAYPSMSIAYIPEGKRVAFSQMGEVVLLSAETWTEERRLSAHSTPILTMDVATHGRWLLTGSLDSQVHLWDMQALERIATYDHTPLFVLDAAFSPDDERIAVVSGAGTLAVWMVDAPEAPRFNIQAHSAVIVAVAFAPDGETIITGAEDTHVAFWDSQTGQAVGRDLVHPTKLSALLFTHDGEMLVTSAYDQRVRFWKSDVSNPLTQVLTHPTSNAPVFTPDGQTIASVSLQGITFNDLETGMTTTYTHENALISSYKYNRDGSLLLFGTIPGLGNQGEVLVLDTATRSIVQSFDWTGRLVGDVVWSSDESMVVASGWSDGGVVVWSTETGERLFEDPTGVGCMAVALTSDDRYLAVLCYESLRVYDLETQTLSWQRDVPGTVTAMTFVPDSTRLIMGIGEHFMSEWDVTTQSHLRDFIGHRKPVVSMVVNATGTRLISGSEDGTARIWDMATGHELRRFESQTVDSVNFSPDSQYAVVNNGLNATLWNVALDDDIAYLCSQITRDLTDEERTYYGIEPDAETCGGYRP
jgi:serine/threonine protein kinase/WD40 repeat protein